MKKIAGLLIFSAILFLSYQVCSGESGASSFSVSYDGSITEYDDASAGIKAAVSLDELNDTDLQSLRNYYNDKKSTEDELFDKYVKLQRSYIPAMQDLFTASFFYGDQGKPLSESNMKLFYEGSERVFGQMSAVYLYNIIKSDGLQMNEETHLDISVPLKADRALLSIRITMKAGNLNRENIGKIKALLEEIHPGGSMSHTAELRLFDKPDLLDAANTGIYQAQSAEGQGSSLIEDKHAGFAFSLPYGFVPYMQNRIGGRLQYRSYKINPNHVFSISTQPLKTEGGLESAVAGIRTSEGWWDVKDEGLRRIGDKDYYYVKYDGTVDGGAVHIIDYFTADHSILYRLQLNSRLEEPSPVIIREFYGILFSFGTVEPETVDLTGTPLEAAYANEEEGVSFNYPGDWDLTEISESIEYDRLQLVFPELSGPLEITISEGELKKAVGPGELPSFLTGRNGSADANVLKYDSPYAGNPVKVLSISSRTAGSVLYVYRLLDYLDPYGRNRLTYSIDILKGTKIHSMFFSLGEYATVDGRPKTQAVEAAIDAIAASFRIEDTPQALAREAAGETRNRKIVFVEEELKKKVDPGLKVAGVSDTAADGSLFVKVVNTGVGGYYKVLPDFAGGGLTILDRTLTSIILQSELDKLKKTYTDRVITGTYINEANMTIRIDSSRRRGSPVFTRMYRVDAGISGNSVVWKTTRPNHEQELKLECKVFLFTYLSSDVDMQYDYDNVFKDMSAYAAKNMTFRTLVHVSGGSMDSFLTLEIDTLDDDISVVSTESTEDLLKEIDKNLGFGRSGYRMASYSFDKSDFSLKLQLESVIDGSAKSVNLKIQYNPENQTIDYKMQ